MTGGTGRHVLASARRSASTSSAPGTATAPASSATGCTTRSGFHSCTRGTSSRAHTTTLRVERTVPVGHLPLAVAAEDGPGRQVYVGGSGGEVVRIT